MFSFSLQDCLLLCVFVHPKVSVCYFVCRDVVCVCPAVSSYVLLAVEKVHYFEALFLNDGIIRRTKITKQAFRREEWHTPRGKKGREKGVVSGVVHSSATSSVTLLCALIRLSYVKQASFTCWLNMSGKSAYR